MKRILISLSFTLALTPFANAANPCVLGRAVLEPYVHAEASDTEWAESRRTVSNFMACAPESVDIASRRIFREVVRRELRADHSKHFERWEASHPGSEALFEGIGIYRYELREYRRRLAARTR
jgi:hypothetical protein